MPSGRAMPFSAKTGTGPSVVEHPEEAGRGSRRNREEGGIQAVCGRGAFT